VVPGDGPTARRRIIRRILGNTPRHIGVEARGSLVVLFAVLVVLGVLVWGAMMLIRARRRQRLRAAEDQLPEDARPRRREPPHL
jgi:cytoskeletal protein RodZ